jgi:hypothetical protein
MHIDGACHCGHISFQAEIDPEQVGLCNCTDCQTMSGSAFRWVAPARKGSFKLLAGTPKVYLKTGESGAKRQQAFCPECGTAIYSSSVDPDPKVYILRAGAIAQRNQLIPKRQIWARSAQPWVAGIAGIPRIEKH